MDTELTHFDTQFEDRNGRDDIPVRFAVVVEELSEFDHDEAYYIEVQVDDHPPVYMKIPGEFASYIVTAQSAMESTFGDRMVETKDPTEEY